MPVGLDSMVVMQDGRAVKTVMVLDKRLPTGWFKHFYQKGGQIGKWDCLLEHPSGKVYRNKIELKQHFDAIGETYNADVYDFALHKRRAKELRLCSFTADYLAILSQKSIKTVADPATPKADGTPNTSVSDQLANPDDFIMVGSLKVQIIENLFRCPQEGCLKNFRKENHLQIHIKHYHEDLAKLLGVCPNMTDLAYLRTASNTGGGQMVEEPIPKNHLTNSQFFEKVHQNDIQAKNIRRSIGLTSPPVINTSPQQQSTTPSLNASTIKQEVTEVKVEDAKPTTPTTAVASAIKRDESSVIKKEKLEEVAEVKVELVTPKRKTILEEALNTTTKVISTPPMTTSTPNPPPSSDTPLAPTSKKKKNNSGVRRKIAKSRVILKKHQLHRKLSEFIEYDDTTRHSFIGSPEINCLNSTNTNTTNTNNTNTNTTENTNPNSQTLESASQSPKYINEDGEVIKIVRMKQEEIINCICSFPEENGLMIQCELCLCWQHGACNDIERENQVPEKYVCYICRHPNRPRESLKYKHDQEWLYEGRLPCSRFNTQNLKREERFNILKESHKLTGNLLDLKNFLHSLRVKINISEKRDHPKMYLWSKKWESTPDLTSTKPQLEIKTEDQNKMKAIVGLGMEPMEVAAASTSTAIKVEDDKNNDKKEEQLLESLLQTPGGTSIDFEKELDKERTMANRTPNIPQPEAPIDPAECQLRLLEHIQKQQSATISRLQSVEAQIIGNYELKRWHLVEFCLL